MTNRNLYPHFPDRPEHAAAEQDLTPSRAICRFGWAMGQGWRNATKERGREIFSEAAAKFPEETHGVRAQ